MNWLWLSGNIAVMHPGPKKSRCILIKWPIYVARPPPLVSAA
jgi:hypothetical protein